MNNSVKKNLILHIFLIIIIYSMFRDVPECSGMFRDVPCSRFYRRPPIIVYYLRGKRALAEIEPIVFGSAYHPEVTLE